MNEQQIVEQGTHAETLLNSDAFNKTVKSLLDNYVGIFFNTDPKEHENREAAYFSARAMQELISTLNQQVQMKNQQLQPKE
jgi:hypothetical protein